MTSPDITPQQIAQWKSRQPCLWHFGAQKCSEHKQDISDCVADLHVDRSMLFTAYERVVGELSAVTMQTKLIRSWVAVAQLGSEYGHIVEALNNIEKVVGDGPEMLRRFAQAEADRDRLTAQLALEQTASTRTIEHLVARKDALEGTLASLADCINLALREANKDHAQVTDYLGDMRPAVNELVYENTRIRQERDALRAALREILAGQGAFDKEIAGRALDGTYGAYRKDKLK